MRRLVGAEDGKRMLQRFELVAEVVKFLKGHCGFRQLRLAGGKRYQHAGVGNPEPSESRARGTLRSDAHA
ncbi:hypothetical protein GCM10007880_40160 [Mesorhizobium amorphae]|nr:hypothetical protein GCM10007880_40160 [Mesorhizobium amorphae]